MTWTNFPTAPTVGILGNTNNGSSAAHPRNNGASGDEGPDIIATHPTASGPNFIGDQPQRFQRAQALT